MHVVIEQHREPLLELQGDALPHHPDAVHTVHQRLRLACEQVPNQRLEHVPILCLLSEK